MTGQADQPGLRSGPLAIPNLVRLGIGFAHETSVGETCPGLSSACPAEARWGVGREISRGKDTPSGHWEIAGVPVRFDWGYFPDRSPAFPPQLVSDLIEQAGLPGILGDRHASGTAILDEFGPESVRSAKPICYTSADSVFQIAAHEEVFGLERLYETCQVARRLCDPLLIGRVIARPFTGIAASGFRRSPNRRDYAIPPPGDTLLDILSVAGREVVSIGKVGDIFAHRGTGREVKAAGNDACLSAAIEAFAALSDGGLVFANLVDFDSEFGHRRDVAGYAAALEAFDRRIPDIGAALACGDLCVITADHGNDPTFRGTDHTRERVPILAFGPGLSGGSIGIRDTLADIGATLAQRLGVPNPGPGRCW